MLGGSGKTESDILVGPGERVLGGGVPVGGLGEEECKVGCHKSGPKVNQKGHKRTKAGSQRSQHWSPQEWAKSDCRGPQSGTVGHHKPGNIHRVFIYFRYHEFGDCCGELNELGGPSTDASVSRSRSEVQK